MRNEKFQDRPGNARYQLCPASIVAGDIVLIGPDFLPAVALESYDANGGGAPFRFSGTYRLSVYAATSVSPLVGSAVKDGDTIYAEGTLDAATGVTYNLTLSKDSDGHKVGTYDDQTPLTSGTLNTAAAVRLREVGA